MEAELDCPTFIDLRAFAKAGGASPGTAPDSIIRKSLTLRGGPVEIGSLHFAAGRGHGGGNPGDEFLIVAEGEIAITTPDQTRVLREGESLVLVSGAPFEWSATAPATLIFMRYVNGSGDAPRIVPIDPNVELKPSGAPLAELLVGETPACRNDTTYLSSDGEFMCGVWDSTPYHRLPMTYRQFELMYLLRGSVTFADEKERSHTFGKGDIFVVEQHAKCSWHSREDVAKVYAIWRPAA